MDFQRIQIDGFGTLSELAIDDLTAGLNVYYGANGSGKTTILHFVRGLFCGFEEARRLELLPPVRGGLPGGSITLAADRSRFTIVRRGRPGETEALAIQVRQGTTEEAQTLRRQIEHLDRDLVYLLYFVGSYEAHSLSGLVQLALRDGIDLSTTRTDAAWIDPLTASVEARRRLLWDHRTHEGILGEREAAAQAAARQFENAAALQRTRQESVVEELRRLRMHLQRLEGEHAWLLAEIQPVEADLTECQTRLWSRQSRIVRDVQRIVQPEESTEAGWVRELHELDRQIEHAKQVLRDLAAARLRLTLESTTHVCAETPDEAATLESQRRLLNGLEQQARQLQTNCQAQLTARQRGICSCDTLLPQLEGHLTELRQTIYVLCQQLSRRQTVIDRQRWQSELGRIDQCEGEVLERIRRLRLRRDELISASQSPIRSQLRHAVSHETQHCRCEAHADFSAKLPLEMEVASRTPCEVVRESTVEESDARPGDQTLEKSLIARRLELRRRQFELQKRIRDARSRVDQLQAEQSRFADDHSVMDLHFAHRGAEEEVTEVRDEWTSLSLQKMLLSEARVRMHREEYSRVIAEASGYLNRFTQGRYRAFEYDLSTRELLVCGADGRRLPSAALSRGTLDQSALSFRLALVAEYARRGVRLPLVLDDVLVDSDEIRLASAVEVLKEVASNGQQIIFLTCQEHLSDLFDEHGFPVRVLGGGVRSTRRVIPAKPSPARVTPEVVAMSPLGTAEHIDSMPDTSSTRARDLIVHSLPLEQPLVSPVPHVVENSAVGSETPRLRLQPEGPYWLRVDSALQLLPSLSAQMAGRLAALGIGNLGELIVLDLETLAPELSTSQISPVQFRQWQAEARLLCCVPDLTGPEGQLLAAVGIQNPVELGAENGDGLYERIERARQQGSEFWQPWMDGRSDWPDREQLRIWIRNGRRAMTLRAASQWAGWRPKRLHDLEAGDWDPWTSDRHRPRREPREVDRDDRDPRDRDDSSGRRRPRVGQFDRTGLISQSGPAGVAETGALRFYLNPEDPVVDAPSIGPKMADRMASLGILTVQDLLQRPAVWISQRLGEPKISEETLTTWQAQSSLMCQMPGLRGHDAMLLVACDVVSPQQLSSYSPDSLLALVGPFADSREGQRMLRSANPPDLEEVSDWIHWSRMARPLRIAS